MICTLFLLSCFTLSVAKGISGSVGSMEMISVQCCMWGVKIEGQLPRPVLAGPISIAALGPYEGVGAAAGAAAASCCCEW